MNIKNIIFDVGRVIFDDRINNLDNKYGLSKEKSLEIGDITFGSNFKECMLGKMSLEDYESLMINKYPEYKEYISYLLDPTYYNETFPIIKESYEEIKRLYNKGYNLYILSNNTKESLDYVMSIMDKNIFKGIVSSFEEGILKPDIKIYELILNRYNLEKESTIFFDDNASNIEGALNAGITSIQVKNTKDILNITSNL